LRDKRKHSEEEKSGLQQERRIGSKRKFLLREVVARKEPADNPRSPSCHISKRTGDVGRGEEELTEKFRHTEKIQGILSKQKAGENQENTGETTLKRRGKKSSLGEKLQTAPPRPKGRKNESKGAQSR